MLLSPREAFLAIESDLLLVSRYIEFCKENMETYSFELARLLITIGSEVDIALKIFCREVDNNAELENMSDYKKILLNDEKMNNVNGTFNVGKRFWDKNVRIDIPEYSMHLHPWQGLEHDKKLPWWDAYNNIKHNRIECYMEANLRNVLSAAAGLFYIIRQLYFSGPNLMWDKNAMSPGYRIFVVSGETMC